MTQRGIGLALVATLFAGAASAQEDIASFYRGKNVQMIVGSSAGGGYDLYGRLVARAIGKHIPANPTVIVRI